jgi:hypothetical protein
MLETQLIISFLSFSFSTLLIILKKILFLIYFDGYKLSLIIYFNLFFYKIIIILKKLTFNWSFDFEKKNLISLFANY